MRVLSFCLAGAVLASCSQATFIERAAEACQLAGFVVGSENYERCVLRQSERERATVANTFTNLRSLGWGALTSGPPLSPPPGGVKLLFPATRAQADSKHRARARYSVNMLNNKVILRAG
jgi:hypothetical protein